MIAVEILLQIIANSPYDVAKTHPVPSSPTSDQKKKKTRKNHMTCDVSLLFLISVFNSTFWLLFRKAQLPNAPRQLYKLQYSSIKLKQFLSTGKCFLLMTFSLANWQPYLQSYLEGNITASFETIMDRHGRYRSDTKPPALSLIGAVSQRGVGVFNSLFKPLHLAIL